MPKKVCVVGIVIENNKDKILLLLKNKNRPEGGKWGAVGGKIEKNETSRNAAIREINEEIGIELNPNDLVFNKTLHWNIVFRKKDFSIVYKSFYIKLKKQFKINLNTDENSKYLWINAHNAYKKKGLAKGMCIILENFLGIPSRNGK